MLLFSNPPHPRPFEAQTSLTVRLSDDDGRTWKASREVYSGPGACSSLADGSTIGLLYESGEEHPYEKITFARFNLEWLTQQPVKGRQPVIDRNCSPWRTGRGS